MSDSTSASVTTGWADPPVVRVLNQPAGNPTTVEMHWCTAPDGAQWASVTFETVLAYRWSDFDLGDPRTDRDQFEFGLIRITESELVDQLLNGADRLDPAEWYGSSMARGDIRHYRIAFDDHGVYDIVCGGLHIAHAPEPPPR
ncbi:hypothetical protein FOH10_11975 [Nocardia otitidiscaviarum]|uniref:Uncharacterized protein n=1 Tax=Nocardia otitidiscaviarum TaxID=1823 RepID=A0A516NKA4_9NOCA|nr:hypothetical protein [Nocardia otitidiscaviarum]MCP9624803.1 hypothetical protein [Nocardia otitidiscaviarum]QDP79330.1 hypothetical protein FOH10_11975 [Nocardia otitidiscaviarum]